MLKLGDIVLVDIPDPDGQPCQHAHPALILRGPGPTGIIYVLGISTKFTKVERFWIRLPDGSPRHPVTGLDRPSVVKCNWLVKFNSNQVIATFGEMPADLFKLAIEYVTQAIAEKKTGPYSPDMP